MKIDVGQFKVKLLRKQWRCLCKECGKEWLWLTRKRPETKEPLDVVCGKCIAKIH